jgi:hypothetical protein
MSGEAWDTSYISMGRPALPTMSTVHMGLPPPLPPTRGILHRILWRDAPQGSSRSRTRPPPQSGPRGYAALVAEGAGARWSDAWVWPSRGARTKRRRSRSRRARPHIWRFSIFRRLMCPSTGLVLQGTVAPALMASSSSYNPVAKRRRASSVLEVARVSHGSSCVGCR